MLAPNYLFQHYLHKGVQEDVRYFVLKAPRWNCKTSVVELQNERGRAEKRAWSSCKTSVVELKNERGRTEKRAWSN